MKTVMIALGALVVVAVLFVVGIYNKLVTLRNRFKNAYAQIDVQLKRRYDLIPNLVETAKGYIKHERDALGRLLAVSEAYPDLKANTTMLSLMEELTSTENKVSFSRQAYNDSVMAYNTQREIFPSSAIAAMFHFTAAELFVIEKVEQREAPKVAFV
jgi:LemA protein